MLMSQLAVVALALCIVGVSGLSRGLVRVQMTAEGGANCQITLDVGTPKPTKAQGTVSPGDIGHVCLTGTPAQLGVGGSLAFNGSFQSQGNDFFLIYLSPNPYTLRSSSTNNVAVNNGQEQPFTAELPPVVNARTGASGNSTLLLGGATGHQPGGGGVVDSFMFKIHSFVYQKFVDVSKQPALHQTLSAACDAGLPPCFVPAGIYSTTAPNVRYYVGPTGDLGGSKAATITVAMDRTNPLNIGSVLVRVRYGVLPTVDGVKQIEGSCGTTSNSTCNFPIMPQPNDPLLNSTLPYFIMVERVAGSGPVQFNIGVE